MAASNDEIPALAWVHLLGRGPGPLSFRNAKWPVAALFRTSSGARFARAIIAS